MFQTLRLAKIPNIFYTLKSNLDFLSKNLKHVKFEQTENNSFSNPKISIIPQTRTKTCLFVCELSKKLLYVLALLMFFFSETH